MYGDRFMTTLQGVGLAVVAGVAGAAGAEPEAMAVLGDAAPMLTPALTAGATFAGTVMAMAKILPRLTALEKSLKTLQGDVRRMRRGRPAKRKVRK